MKPLRKCANGCDCPPDPPSLVICKDCQDKITRKLRKMVKGKGEVNSSSQEEKITDVEYPVVLETPLYRRIHARGVVVKIDRDCNDLALSEDEMEGLGCFFGEE